MKNINRISIYSIVIIGSFFLLTNCSNNIQGVITETDSTRTSVAVVGKDGGTIKFDDKTSLEIPSGSLNEEVNISLTRLKDSSSANQKDKVIFNLEPEGTVFSKPATLTVSYADISSGNGSLQAYSCSNGNWEELLIKNIDESEKKAEIELNHFSIFVLHTSDLYLVVDIPGKYLLKGDLIYTLAYYEIKDKKIDNFHWFPGHTGLYLGPDDSDENIIESTPDHVQHSTLNLFINNPDHLFMGARRFIGNINDEQRQHIADFAIHQLNKPYSKVGQGNGISNSLSCVGLTESAYDHSGLSIIPPYLEFPFSFPYDQYRLTKPIDEIIVKSEEEISLKVYGVIWDDVQKYIKTSIGVDISNAPKASNWKKSGDYWEFKWTPGPDNVNNSYKVTFKVENATGGKKQTKVQTINFKVIEKGNITGSFTDSRDGKEYKTVQIGEQIWMAENLAYKPSDGCWAYNNDQSNVSKYGYLYNWETARYICPSGWHLPNKEEFETLFQNVGGSGLNAYNALIPSGESGFSALFGGIDHSNGNFVGIGEGTYFWSMSAYDANNAWYMQVSSGNALMSIIMISYGGSLNRGYSVRCLKND